MLARLLIVAALGGALIGATPSHADEPPASPLPSPPPESERQLELAATLERAAALLQAGDHAAVRALLAPLLSRVDLPDEARLLHAIALFRLGEVEAARPLFAQLGRGGATPTAETARTFLALLALDDGAVDEGRRQLAASQRLAPSLGTERLLERAAGKRLRLLLLVQPGFDSNVALQPNLVLPLAVTATADGHLLTLAWLSVRPLRAVQWFLETTASYRLQFTQRSYDYFQHLLSSRYAWLGRNDRVSASVAFGTYLLGGELLLVAPQASLRYQRRLAQQLFLAVDYGYQYRRYAHASYTFLTGHENNASAELGWGMPEQRWQIAVGYLLSSQSVLDRSFSALGHYAILRARLRRRFFEGGLLGRAGVANFLEGRRDVQLALDVSASFDVRREVAIVLGAALLRNQSSLHDFSYWKISASLGVVVTWAGL